MRHDIITATLPVSTLLAELARLQAKHGEAKLNAAGLQLRTDPDLAWTMPLLARVDEHLSALAEQVQDTAMLQRDDPKPAAPAPAAEDPLSEVRDAIITALAAASIEGSERENELRLGYILDEVKRAIYRTTLAHTLLSPPLAAGQIHRVDPAQFEESDGLLVEHKPGARVKGGAL